MSYSIPGNPYYYHHVTGHGQLALKNVTLEVGRTYFIHVFFTAEVGSPTDAKCSSVWFNSGNIKYGLSSYSAYHNTRYKLYSWIYAFEVDNRTTPAKTTLDFLVDNSESYGYDGQYILLYYAKYWDSQGNVYNEWKGSNYGKLFIYQDGNTYTPVFFSSMKYTTPSLAYVSGSAGIGKPKYIPLVEKGKYWLNSTKWCYDPSKYPRIAVQYNGKTYYVVNSILPLKGALRPSQAVISATSYGGWSTYQKKNKYQFSFYRTASATVSVTKFDILHDGAYFNLASLTASGSSGYATANGVARIDTMYSSLSEIGTKSVQVSATTSYRPSAGTGLNRQQYYSPSIPLTIILFHKDISFSGSASMSITWPSVTLNTWE